MHTKKKNTKKTPFTNQKLCDRQIKGVETYAKKNKLQHINIIEKYKILKEKTSR